MPKTTLRQKVFLILFGVFLTLVGIEIVLRLGGFIFLTLQEQRNRASLVKNGEYRIMCVGESTTALGGEDAYPRQLEKILNAGQDNIKFTVVNKGIPAITSHHIVLHLEDYLSQYKPHMVVAMMGVNDTLENLKSFPAAQPRWMQFFEEFRVLKLLRFLNLHWTANSKARQDPRFKQHLEKLEQELNAKPSSAGFTKLAHLSRASGHPDKEFRLLSKALELDANNSEAKRTLGFYYKRIGEYAKAVQLFEEMRQAMGSDEKLRLAVYAELGESYKLWGKIDQAERIFKEAIIFFPRHPGAYAALAEIYLEQGRYEEAEKFFKRQLEVNSGSVPVYGQLAHCYRRQGRAAAAERLLRQGVQLNPQEVILYAELGHALLADQKYAEAEVVLTNALELNPQNPEGIAQNLLVSYEKQGKTAQAEQLKKNTLSQKERFTLQLRENYRQVKTMVSQAGLKLVAVQYPLRPSADLKQMLEADPAVLFVDNQQIFQDAVSREGYDEYFTDRFAGDFGHCTAKGNQLLANNIAQVIATQLLAK